MNPLLRSQLRLFGLGEETPPRGPDQWRAFLERVDEVYRGQFEDRGACGKPLDLPHGAVHGPDSGIAHHTESHQTDDRDSLQAILGCIADGVCLLSATGKIELHNKAAKQLLGYDADDSMNGRNFNAHLPPELRRKVADFLAAADSGHPLAADVSWFTRIDGSALPVSFVLSPVADQRTSIGFVLLFRDITQHMRMVDESEQARLSAERADRAKTKFLSHISHELRTPLNSILGFAQLLERDQDLGPEQRDISIEIARAGRHLLTIIDELRDLAQIEAGRLALFPEDLDLQEILYECSSLCAPLAEAEGIDLRLPDCVGLSVNADPTRLKQVLLNLLSNAIKYSQKNDLVTVSCGKGAEGHIRISVRDTGPGIPQDRQQHLFDPFSRLGAETTSTEGTGLGLSISQRLVTMMGGTMGFESVPGVGSTFSIELRLAQSTPATVPAVDAETPESQVIPARIKGRILCIEDNPASLRLIAQVIEGYTAHEFVGTSSPGEGLELARARTPDLILLDVNLPGMDGFELFQRLRTRAETRDIPVIAVSANAMPATIERATSAGFLDYFTKPIDIDRLLTRINDALVHRN